jgi:riboflavin synthase
MFTGLVEHVGTIASLERSDSGLPRSERGACSDPRGARPDYIGARIRVNAGPLAAGLAKSGSIAVNGCCLTAVEISGESFTADLSGETLRRTSFGEMEPGTRVNLERPLTAMKELGGHFMQGHVDGIGHVARLEPQGANWWFGVTVPDELARYVARKGSIALDGISLTVAGWHAGIVETAIVPFTYENTNLSSLTLGDAVNIECDVLAKYVERLMEARQKQETSGLTVARLVEEGF